MEAHELLVTAGRGILVYVFVLIVIRLLGKRTIGNFTAFDLLIALMLGELVDEIIYGDVSLAQGFVAITTISLAKYITTWLAYWDHGFDAILEGTPTVVIENGQFQRKGMRKEQINEKEIMAQLRLNGIDDLREIKLAVIEDSGEVSFIKQDWAQELQKSDIDKNAAQLKASFTGNTDPSPSQNAISSQMLR